MSDPSEMEIDELFFGMLARFRAHARACAESLDLSLLQLIAIRHLDEPMPMGRLAEVLFSDPSVMTAVADGLEAQGYLERRTSESDRRVKELVLTEDGRALKREVHRRLATGNPALEPLDTSERKAFSDLLRKMVRAS